MNMLQFSIYFEKFGRKLVDLKFEPGLHVIYGNSGTGKSSFITSLLGEANNNSFLNFSLNHVVKPESISVIYQNPDSQIVSPTIESELAFSFENQFQEPEAIEVGVNMVLESLNFKPNLHQNPLTLSGGEKELLNIATGLSTKPKCVFIDDGLSFLSDTAKKICVEQLNNFIQSNNSIILWFTSDVNDLNFGNSCWELTLSDFKKTNSGYATNYDSVDYPNGEFQMAISNLNFNYGCDNVISDLSIDKLTFRSFGLTGDNGSGKTTLAHLIQGIYEPNSGSFDLIHRGKPVKQIAYLDQFPENLLMGRSFSFILDQLILQGKINVRLVSTFKKRLERFHIQWDAIAEIDPLDLPWATLRLTFIVLLTHCEYSLILLDEPSFGLGWEQKVTLRNYLIERMKQKHFFIISHDQLFLNAVCDTILDLDCKQKSKPLKQNDRKEKKKKTH